MRVFVSGLQHLEKEQELEAVEEDAKRPKTEEKEEEEEAGELG